MVTHADSPKFNTRWYYHVMAPGKKTMVHADNKYLQDMKFQYLHREADGTYTKVVGDQWLQNDLLMKHKEFKDDASQFEQIREEKQNRLNKKTERNVKKLVQQSVDATKQIKKSSSIAKTVNSKIKVESSPAEELNKKNKVLTDTEDKPKKFSSDVLKSIEDMKKKDTAKNIPGF